MAKIAICADCGEEKRHHAKGLCRACYYRRWYREHREEKVAYQCLYREEHRVEVAAYQRLWHRENREDILARQCRYRAENREDILARVHRWQQENPDKVAGSDARRKARKRALPNTLTPEQAEHLFEVGQATYPGEDLHLDHIVPLSRGGGTTLANMHAIPARVNQSKNDALPQEIYQQEALL